jgi:hypothetical protein
MASLTRKPRSKYWFACFRDVNGKQRRKSTGHTDRKKALKIAEQFEQVGQRKLAPRTVRGTLAELYREVYSETLPVATVRKFIADWLHTKRPEVSAGICRGIFPQVADLLDSFGVPTVRVDTDVSEAKAWAYIIYIFFHCFLGRKRKARII